MNILDVAEQSARAMPVARKGWRAIQRAFSLDATRGIDMPKSDHRVAQLNRSIESRLTKYESTRRHLPEVAAYVRVQRTLMADHQPEGGRWGALCLADHDPTTPWPCDGVQKFDSPTAYFD
jgi:hypothetical protein